MDEQGKYPQWQQVILEENKSLDIPLVSFEIPEIPS